MQADALPWISLFALGAMHGINPAMGWLFAVGRGLFERDRRALWRALGPLALGHGAAIAVAVLVAIVLGEVLPTPWLRWIVAAALLLLGVEGLVRHRHVRFGGMRMRGAELTAWSFLMATAHGAGLMILPLLVGRGGEATSSAHHHHGRVVDQVEPLLSAGVAGVDALALAAPLIHTVGYLLVTAALAVVVYDKLGLRVLRRAWINVNLLWAGTLVATAFAAALL